MDWTEGPTPRDVTGKLLFQGGASWRKRLLDDIGDQGAVTKLIEGRTDEELARLMSNLGGHDLPSIVEAFDTDDHDRPTCFVAYTIKASVCLWPGHERDRFEGLSVPPDQLQAFLDSVPIGTPHGCSLGWLIAYERQFQCGFLSFEGSIPARPCADRCATGKCQPCLIAMKRRPKHKAPPA
jgi:hypothetical protein